MKLFNNILMLWALALLLIACGQRTGSNTNGFIRDPVIYIDRATGCHYLATGQHEKGSLTPRMDQNGKHICRLQDSVPGVVVG